MIKNIYKLNRNKLKYIKMLDKIKSKFFVKILFNQLDVKEKFKLIRYNKKSQNELNINLLDYRRVSKKYLIVDTNGKGKEYFYYNDKLSFEGEYKNGKRDGKGKEYNNVGKLLFEGEYKNGKRNGKGKEYNISEKLVFEGEYSNGKKWNGKIFNSNNNNFEELKDGKGYIHNYYRNGKLKFEGEYLNGEKWNGKGFDKFGKEIYELKNGNGKVREFNNNGRLEFEGEYLNGKRNGKGKENDYSGRLIYEGEFVNGIKFGVGKSYINSYINPSWKKRFYPSIIFEGDYINDKRNGKGKEYNHQKGLIFEGEYLYDERKKGKEYVDGTLEFEGEYLNNKKWNGKGYDKNGNILYELHNGNGKIIQYDEIGLLIFKGNYLDGKKNGTGEEYTNYDDGAITKIRYMEKIKYLKLN